MSTFIHPDDPHLNEAIRDYGQEIWRRARGEVPSLFNREYWQGRMLEWAMRDPQFKVDLFRFVDVLPVLQTGKQVSQHVREYLLKEGRELPGVVGAALDAAWGGLTAGLASRTLKRHVTEMAERFIAGHNPPQALASLRRLHRQGIAFSVDLLGEATLSEAEVEAYAGRYMDLIETLAETVSEWPSDERIDRNHLGPIPRASISLKLSALSAHLRPEDPDGAVRRLKGRVLPLFLRAREKNVFINVDLEQWALHGITYDLFEEIATHPELRGWPHMGIVVQAYLKTASQDVERLLGLARSRGAPLTVRLVKGAYWDYEVVHARQHGYPCPVLTHKAATDAAYERLSAMLLSYIDHLFPAFGSHNLRSLSHALVLAGEMKVPERACEVQMLYGMAEPERKAIAGLGHRLRVYAPVGDLLPGMAYLVRRLLENTSNSGFLRLTYHDKQDIGVLLAPPEPPPQQEPGPRTAHGGLEAPFENCPLSDFTDPEVRASFARAVEAQPAAFPVRVPVVVSGKARTEGKALEHVCPSAPERIVARVSLATPEEADRAVRAALEARTAWRDRPLRERATLLEKLADRLQADRFELAALQTFEEAKPWRQADADVAEAVDFCRYYARQALSELAPCPQGDMWGEENTLVYEGRGPTAVIAPWNFPLAILCGMATAALVAGNPVLLKPAEQSGAVAYALYERMRAVGFPSDVVHFLPGLGEEIGARLVAHPLVAQIAFTGSRAVGLAIVEQAAQAQPGQPQVKRVVCEMGGKNAIVVDDDADLDEAVAGVMESAFGYAGQKCSACSRALVVGAAYEPLVARLVEACRSILVAPAHDPACELGPVIDGDAHERLLGIVRNPGEGARPLYVGEVPDGGFYVPPALFEVDDPDHRLMQEELFGPVLAVMRVDDFDAALRIATATDYALTGAVYSRSPGHLQEARKRFRVGNLYLNRPCTGAMVGRQPFGGFGMSGGGTKSGGPGYLLHFADPRVVCEDTMRRGFTPDVEM